MMNLINSPLEEKFFEKFKEMTNENYKILKQVPIAKYRTDFKIMNLQNNRFVFIEIDGLKWHRNFTHKQITKMCQRQRYFVLRNLSVLHFSGGEIYHNCEGCVQEILRFLQ